MTYKNQILFGRIARINGNEGSVSVKLETAFIENIPEMESVFLEIEGKPVPFFISASEYSGGESVRFRFDGYGTFEKLSEFNGCLVYLTSEPEWYKEVESNKDITGFSIVTPDKRVLGTITRIISNPGQDLLSVISSSGKEILIPLHEDLIVSYNRKKKLVVMNLPEGLAEIN
jgi:16S rRNA processing protein RimM